MIYVEHTIDQNRFAIKKRFEWKQNFVSRFPRTAFSLRYWRDFTSSVDIKKWLLDLLIDWYDWLTITSCFKSVGSSIASDIAEEIWTSSARSWISTSRSFLIITCLIWKTSQLKVIRLYFQNTQWLISGVSDVMVLSKFRKYCTEMNIIYQRWLKGVLPCFYPLC